MLLGVEQGRGSAPSLLVVTGTGLKSHFPQGFEALTFLGCKARMLPLFDLFSRDFEQLIGARLADQDRDFVVGRPPSVFGSELVDGLIPLAATLAVALEQGVGDAPNLKTGI